MRKIFLVLLLLGLGCTHSSGSSESPIETSGVYILGSSYSKDTRPDLLDNDPLMQLYCAKPLYFIRENPEGHCITGPPQSPTLWMGLLVGDDAHAFDAISFQPIPGGDKFGDPDRVSTQAEDIEHILFWLKEQSTEMIVVIHANWPFPSNWEGELHEVDADHEFTNHSIDYFYDLKRQLEKHPDNRHRDIILTRTNEMIDYIRHDPDAYVSFEDLFFDADGHMSRGPGWYLQHNAMRQAMGQEESVPVNGYIDPEGHAYLDMVINLHSGWD